MKKLRQLLLLFGLFYFFSACTTQPVIVRKKRESAEPKQAIVTTPSKSYPQLAPRQTTPVPAVELKKEDYLATVNYLDELRKNTNNFRLSTEIIDTRLTIPELEIAVTEPLLESFKPQMFLRLGKLYIKQKKPDKAAEYLRAVSTLYPQTVYASQASTILSSLIQVDDANSTVIGAVLPLTGKYANVGQHALNAIRMGLGLDKADTANQFRIALFDSQSNPELAAQGVEKLVLEDKVVALLGGFTSREATLIATNAELYSVPYIGFSQKTGLTNIGEYVFRNSLTPEMQVDTLVKFASEKLGAKKFAVLYPNDSYGVEFGNIFWDHVLAHGGEITAAQTYDPKETDFSEPIQKLLGTYYVEARADEYEERLKELSEQKKSASNNKKNSRESWGEENLLTPIVDFDVLFIPDNSRALGQILAFMKYNDVKNLVCLGTNLWNSPDLPKRTSDQNARVYFVDTVDISHSAGEPSEFHKQYFSQYNEEPSIIEIQAYEAAKILREQILQGADSRASLANSLRSLEPSAGVTGTLRMSSQREIERPIHVLTLDSGLVKKIE